MLATNEGERIQCGSQFEGFQSFVEGKVQRNVSVLGGRNSSHESRPGNREGLEPGTECKLQRPAAVDLLPPNKPHFPKVPQPPRVVPQMGTDTPCGAFQIQTAMTVFRVCCFCYFRLTFLEYSFCITPASKFFPRVSCVITTLLWEV